MNLNENETKSDKTKRTSTVDKQILKAILKYGPTLLLIVIILLIGNMIISRQTKEKSIGNPWECVECKEIRSACKDHKDFDKDVDLKIKVETLVYNVQYNYVEDELEFIDAIYNGNTFNSTCDFCLDSKRECAGCKYTRERLTNYIDNILKDTNVTDRFCVDCKKRGYCYCASDSQLVIETVINNIGK